MDLDEELFSFVFHHIFFPKKLPQEVEKHLVQLEHRMAEIIQAALQEFVRKLAPELQPKWEFAQNLVESWLQMHMDQGILQERLETGLSNLKSSGALACHIRAQNCALVVYYDGAKDSLLIDAFEVSCQDAQVLSSSGGLIRHFPGVSVAISGNKLSDRSFCSYLASSISQLASEEVSEMLPKTTRANTTVDEHRATAHPGLITEGLMTQLLALGEENEDAGKILKCVRDEVNWHSALLPWRRSPAWLVLRVALQVVLRRCFPESEDRVQYKNFVLFIMARLSAGANIYHDSNNAVDCWAIIRQRLGRRLFKLKDDVLRFVADEVESASNHLLEKLTSIQDQIRASDRADTPLVPPSASPEDLHLSLLNSRPYLEAMMRLRPGEVQKKEFDPTDTMNLGWSNGLPVLQHDSVVALTELEEWVEEHLQSWFKALSASELEKACVNLEDLMERYCSLAAPKYEDNPRAMSFMILVLLELWVVLDKIATHICPILKNFSPEVPRKFLEPLLLPKMSQMTRATDVEQYIGTRHDERVENYPSIFSDPAPNCFGAHYFDSSDHHKDLETKIQMHAIHLRDRKRMEWEALHAKYNELQGQLARMEHLWGNNRRGNYSHLYGACLKCSVERRAQELSIEVYEWPLPREESTRKCAIFELNLPIWFASWRNTTWKLVGQLTRRPIIPVGKVYTWLNYAGIDGFVVRRHSKLELASQTKAWAVSHHQRYKFPVTFDKISPDNAFRLRLLDSRISSWVGNQTQGCTVKPMCTIQLQPGPYSKLQYAVDSTSHHQNGVLADQADCDRNLDRNEFIAYGCLRSGESLQWHNILRELASPALSLNEQSVVSLIKQAAWELGTPCSSPYSIRRVAHRAFEDNGFGDRLLEILQGILDTIEKNWNEYGTFELVVTLAVRTLILTSGSPSPEKVIDFLRRCREVAMEWCDSLSQALLTDQGKDAGRKQQLIIRIASICQTTYDVERTHMSQAISSSQDLFCFARSSLLLFENAPSEPCGLPESVRNMAMNSQKIAFFIREMVKNLIMAHPSGLNRAIHRDLSCLEISESWSICEGGTTWVTTKSGSTLKGFSQDIHFNYLSGEILVDGLPPGKLPRSYLSDPLYRRLFGPRSLPVIPSNLPGASFVLSQNIEGFEVHFGMAEQDLFVKTRKGSQILQLVPHTVFKKDFPRPFVTEHYHWLNLETGAVEFRPLNHPWTSCESNWNLSFDAQRPDQMLMQVIQGEPKTLVDIRSRPFELFADILNVLDEPEEIILVQTSTGTLEAEVNRLRLKFFGDHDGRVVSKEFGAFVDFSQRIGCLYGLRDKLVVVDSSNARSVIVPYGEPVVTREGHHVTVKIDRPKGDRVKYMVYSMDTHLEILRCSGSLAALYQAHLHALTSFPLPDQFTHRSGTAEAIRILSQGYLRSSFPLNSDCIENLERIAALTPSREFYPRYLRVMQTVAWSGPLGQLALDDDFQPLSQEIVEFADQFSRFHGTEPRAHCVSYTGSTTLLRRARYRNEQLRCAEFGAPLSLCAKNTYHSRDCNVKSPRSNRVYELTALVRDWPSAVDHSSNIVETMRVFKNISTGSADLMHSSCSHLMGLSTERDWVALYDFCRSKSQSRDTYSLISVFAKVTFAGNIDQSLLRQLLSIAFSASCDEIPGPSDRRTSYDLTMGEDFKIGQIEDIITECYTPFASSHYANRRRPNRIETDNDAEEWAKQRRQDARYCGRHIQEQWPTRTPELPSRSLTPLVQREAAQKMCQHLCNNWVQNGQFLDFLRQVQDKVPPSGNGGATTQATSNPPTSCNEAKYSQFKPPGIIELIQRSQPTPSEAEFTLTTYRGSSSIPRPTPELHALAEYFRTSSNVCQQGYGDELTRSIQALEALSSCPAGPESFESSVAFDWLEAASQIELSTQRLEIQRETLWGEIVATLRKGYPVGFDAVCPSITGWSVLTILGSDQWTMIPDQWRSLLVAFGKTISALRRCERLILCINMRNLDEFFKEAENPGYEGWEPLDHPTWLLLELEQNITIRKRQVEVAGQMNLPDCGGNALHQLNMGEGKTTVITAILAVDLANRSNLVRIIVLKALLHQSVSDLSQRLGGLINRRIYHIPVSRNTRFDASAISELQAIYKQCLRDRGILIALPEHILSFRLLGLSAAESSPDIYPSLIRLEHRLQMRCRDIIDESDEVLNTKFQLVYAMVPLDGRASRWEITQDLLRLVSQQAKRLHQHDPSCIQVDQSGYRYPLLRFLKPEAIERLLRYILQAISEGGIPGGLPFNQWSANIKSSVLRFIKDLELNEEDATTVHDKFDGGVFITKLLVLRGHFAYGILRFSLAKKRWLVEYGLHPSRCLMAVPYRAKGVPSENAEFGHPDVAITLTCLSYYYEGLQEEQLRACFLLLAREHDPSTVYHNWVAQCVHDLPSSLRAYSGVNLEDGKTFREVLFPFLRYQKEILDFYLSRVVFSREAKEFNRKLSCSAWDIPARRGLQLTTGFSGTNDNRSLLPLTISQRDLPGLYHTNAMVLSYLLRDCNRQCVLAQDEQGHQLSLDQLLKLVLSSGKCSPKAQPVRVLIDVGAQILEAGNQSVAQKWLSITPDNEVKAAIFFNENDELMVIDCDGHVETLLSSSFRQRLGACLVFLDQQHSRGVDLKLPPTTRAAIVLGPRLTKDSLVQACNRLRGLAKRQSVLFLVPPEVSHNMRSQLEISSDRDFTSADVLRWSMIQTCDALDSLRPLWANQGLQYSRKIALWDLLVKESSPSTQVSISMQEPEGRTLLQHYLPSHADRVSAPNDTLHGLNIQAVQELSDALRSTTGHMVSSASFHEEQEREIASEVERERQVVRPPKYIPHVHRLHKDIKYFAQFGKFPGQHPSSAITLALEGLANTSVGKTVYPNGLGPGLYSSLDFIRTVQVSDSDMEDEFCKAPHWILSSVYHNDLVIVSQYEANLILPIVRQSTHARLNIYSARFTKPMRSFGNLDFFGVGAICRIPSRRMGCCLELFSGSLYFDTFDEYKDFRYFLGLINDHYGDIPLGGVTPEGFVQPFARQQLQWPLDSPFAANPLPFLAELVHIRTRGSGYQQSHVGSIIRAIQLTLETF